ncbi:MAG: hypothetical protein WKF57_21905 [Nakamurella sp.]
MVHTFTDAGGVDLMRPGLDFRITFSGSTATVTGDCSLRYPKLRVVSGSRTAMIDLGTGIGDDPCTVGADPWSEPNGTLFVQLEGGTLDLSTGYVGWTFREVG